MDGKSRAAEWAPPDDVGLQRGVTDARWLYFRARPPECRPWRLAVVPTPMPPLAIRAFTATTALGRGRDAQRAALRERRSGLRRNDFGA